MASSTTKPGRDGECHQRKIIQAEPGEVHDAERADQGKGQRHTWDDRRPDSAQEDKDHQDHQHDSQDQGELNVVHRGPDRLGPVGEDRNFHCRRNRGGKFRKQLLNSIDGLNDVRAGLTLDIDQNGRLVADPGS